MRSCTNGSTKSKAPSWWRTSSAIALAVGWETIKPSSFQAIWASSRQKPRSQKSTWIRLTQEFCKESLLCGCGRWMRREKWIARLSSKDRENVWNRIHETLTILPQQSPNCESYKEDTSTPTQKHVPVFLMLATELNQISNSNLKKQKETATKSWMNQNLW